ncbi:hypothetical protein TrispH2_008636 [Trichoplax sp. H2]|uniref:Uncharacterized protein n=1 Tax=Trichoplax adhaerens TaxID=10228 RepID=B3SAM6_TRIAD|nr:hypothetical protein TRIADDRAFT_61313 [Trichoplax adhaerens]EDV20181.1 hypothetical protein TRIADDRAFT_61313 [Trichoplax adhaerens]RDD38068.1 hypothetical protein TrispH2_008636 [Trichoplax sp. H2]|eukprot:XP_002117342.1 hypothetical protein TRIADDRAFT_61313 [Trichoplax adhaerens]
MNRISLATIDVGTLQLRVIYLIKYQYVSTMLIEDSQCIPLYLGADVLKSSSIRTENLPRVHSNYAKEGLATKLTMDNISIKGIRGTSNGVWFYSIQGVFKAAFELLSRSCQKSILISLQDTWLAREHDLSLTQDLHVQLIPADQIGSSPIRNSNVEASYTRPDNITSFIDAIVKDICSKLNLSIPSIAMNTLEKVLVATLVLFYQQKWEEIPWKVMIDYANNIVNKNDQKSALQSYCEWIGKVFHTMQPDVNGVVDSFKSRHIHCIDDLPPARDIIKIFPIEMIVLLQTWMANGNHDISDAKWPIVQLVLEFLNQTLITGVSHVVYSKLVEHYDSHDKE